MRVETRPRFFSIAGTALGIESILSGPAPLELPEHFRDFEVEPSSSAFLIRIGEREKLPHSRDPVLFDSKLHWRLRAGRKSHLMELYYPPTAQVYCQAELDLAAKTCSVEFEVERLREMAEAAGTPPELFCIGIAQPLDQILCSLLLADDGGFLVHAAAAVIDGKALVFAGHSGDGKTTLSRLLAQAGMELLSDERVAIRKGTKGFAAYGTPWPGEGNVSSAKSYPLAAVCVLSKADQHRLVEAAPAELAAEVAARSIVPYYFPQKAERVLGTIDQLVSRARLRRLEFALKPGLPALLHTLTAQTTR